MPVGEGGAAEEVGDGHTAFAGELDFEEVEVAVGCGDFEVGLAVGEKGADGVRVGGGGIGEEFGGGEGDFHGGVVAGGGDEGEPGGGVGGESADEVVEVEGGVTGVEAAGVFEDFGCGAGGGVGLGGGGDATLLYQCDGAEDEVGAEVHEAVVEGAGGVGGGDGGGGAEYDVACVDFVTEEEGGDAGLRVAVDYRPVDGGCSAIFGEEGGVEVEGAEGGMDQTASGSIRKATTIWRSAR